MTAVLWIAGAYLVCWVVGMVAICLCPNGAEIDGERRTK